MGSLNPTYNIQIHVYAVLFFPDMLMQLSIAALLAVASSDDVDLCGHTCQQVIGYWGAPCTTKWEQGCYGINPPLGFTSQSTLYELCPNQCPGLFDCKIDIKNIINIRNSDNSEYSYIYIFNH